MVVQLRLVEREFRSLIDPEILLYTETRVIPEYEQNDPAHGVEHARYVVKRAILFGKEVKADINLCFLAAAWHDSMHHVDRKNHEMLSATAFYNDEFLRKKLTLWDMKLVREAIEDHRSSLKGEPRSIYGRILSTADRTTDYKMAIKRTDKFLKRHNPEMTLEERIKTSYEYIKGKYGKDGHAKVYFKDTEFEQMKEKLIEVVQNEEKYRKTFLKLCGYK